MLIERALRDEGASYHYLPPAPYSELRPALGGGNSGRVGPRARALYPGASWTTDAPFRETEAMIARCRSAGILAVEMEAAALYALATAKHQDIICFAHVTNQMAQNGADFEKGVDQGSHAALYLSARRRNTSAAGAPHRTAGAKNGLRDNSNLRLTRRRRWPMMRW